MNNFWHEIIWGVWVFIPAGIANMTPIIVSKLPLIRNWKAPLDMNQTWRGKRLLGPNKTWRGVILGTLAGGIFAVAQHAIWMPDQDTETRVVSFCLGALLGVGALLGDTLESFLKRQRGIKSGDSWFPFDQLDYIVGALIVSYPLFRPSMIAIGSILLSYFGLHLVTRYIGYKLGINEKAI
jgi:CDP-2,3-bis-(O-geranylgeranyl)-sn-glycerol synthase